MPPSPLHLLSATRGSVVTTPPLLPQAFPNSQKIVFADAPHPCYLKAPQYFNSLLLQFAGASSVEEASPAKQAMRVAAQWTAAEAEL